MELEFLAVVANGISTEQEVIWWYFCRGEEMEWMVFTVVWYQLQWTLLRPYTLECTQQVLVSGTHTQDYIGWPRCKWKVLCTDVFARLVEALNVQLLINAMFRFITYIYTL